jgi:hypothetical protein
MKLNRELILKYLEIKNSIEEAAVKIAAREIEIRDILSLDEVWVNGLAEEICIDYWENDEPMQYHIPFDDARLGEIDWNTEPIRKY